MFDFLSPSLLSAADFVFARKEGIWIIAKIQKRIDDSFIREESSGTHDSFRFPMIAWVVIEIPWLT
jgi:hypothetical protein